MSYDPPGYTHNIFYMISNFIHGVIMTNNHTHSNRKAIYKASTSNHVDLDCIATLVQ